MVDDRERQPDPSEEDGDEGAEDRAVILARRKMLVASAMASLAIGAEGCDWLQEKFRASARPCLRVQPNPCLSPQPCLEVQADPRPCLSVRPDPPDATAEPPPQPCLSPQPCLEAQRTPSPCLSQTAPRACLRAAPIPRPGTEGFE
jgi:hypothetical protein